VSDVFEEVEEQLRADRYKTLALKALPWVLGALVLAGLIALGVWGWQAWQSRSYAEASETYAQGVQAFADGDEEQANRLFAEVADGQADGYAALALMQQAGLRLNEEDVQGAVALLDQAAERAPDPIIGDAARLKSALALLDTAPLETMTERLQPLTEEGRPYRAEALEALAFAKLMAGDADGARADFGVIALLPGASEQARQRAQAARALIESGTAKTLPAAVKAAIALPAPEAPAQPQQQGSASQ